MTRAVAQQCPAKSDTGTSSAVSNEHSSAHPAGFDFAVEAELFPTRGRKTKRAAFGYRRFARASEAVRFAIEQLPSDALAGAYLEVQECRFDRNGIQQLYNSDAYPLPRRKVTA
jgi:hypothetical protein